MQFSSAMRPVTVGQLNQYLKEKLARDDALQSICVEGEISNLTLHTSGHIYFTLKDASAAIRAVLFRGYRTSLKFIPANGMRVLLIGDVALYERNGGVQIYVQRMLQAGAGEISLQYEQLKRRLEAEGLFDAAHKRPIPKFPEKICLVTSPPGAALQDIRNVLHRRYPLARVQLCPTMVQGAEAASDIVRALAVADAMRPDVILLARGGGSIEDLYVFNDESVARAIYALHTPVITGIGHETDFTIADFVADLRAPTPSAAAELAVPDQQTLLFDLVQAENRLESALAIRLNAAAEVLLDAKARLQDVLFRRLESSMQALSSAEASLRAAMQTRLAAARHSLQLCAARLEAQNPLSLCARGYGLLQDESGAAIRSAAAVPLQSKIKIHLPDGTLTAHVIEKESRT